MLPADDHPGLADERTRLAATRTALAADRTLMAWVRTALAMISFGFTIYKFLHGLEEVRELHLRDRQGPRNLGLFLTALGTAGLVAALFEYVSTLRALGPGWRRPRLTFYVACVVVLLGVTVLAGIIARIGPF
jgi:putative membrane protein